MSDLVLYLKNRQRRFTREQNIQRALNTVLLFPLQKLGVKNVYPDYVVSSNAEYLRTVVCAKIVAGLYIKSQLFNRVQQIDTKPKKQNPRKHYVLRTELEQKLSEKEQIDHEKWLASRAKEEKRRKSLLQEYERASGAVLGRINPHVSLPPPEPITHKNSRWKPWTYEQSLMWQMDQTDRKRRDIEEARRYYNAAA